MVVLVILGVSLVTISSVQQTTSAQLLQAMRAGYAARAGAEWAAAQAASGTWCPGPAYPETTTFTLPAPLDAFTAAVECTRATHALDGATRQVFAVTVTVSAGAWGSPDYVRRQLRTRVLGP
jgi:MSHA biogenesis protein MshP